MFFSSGAVALFLLLHSYRSPTANLAAASGITFPTKTDSGVEAEAESEVEASAGDRIVAGAVAVGGSVGALGPNSLSQVMVSGSIDMRELVLNADEPPAVKKGRAAIREVFADFDGRRDDSMQRGDGTEGSCNPIATDSSEAEAEVAAR